MDYGSYDSNETWGSRNKDFDVVVKHLEIRSNDEADTKYQFLVIGANKTTCSKEFQDKINVISMSFPLKCIFVTKKVIYCH